MKKKLLNCHGRLISVEHPLVMGILNVTPDSFYDGGRYTTEKEWLKHTELMLKEGADIIDIGCASSRPGAEPMEKQKEMALLTKVVESVAKGFPDAIISVDTYYASVAKATTEAGAAMINDISGGTLDAEMFETVAKLKIPYILMHIQGVPATMHVEPRYNDVVKEVILYLSEKIQQLYKLGLSDIIIDPGFGFGKKIEHNYTLLRNLETFKHFDNLLLVGISRKSMVWKYLKTSPEEALNGSTVLHTIALLAGADILRVHDVKEARECIKIIEALRK